ncbi:MAG TPA: phage tail protein [Chloroflexia bacterium]|nr:phage tail protein [Chloroflexia bacterium]
MDANGVRFHLVLDYDNWSHCLGADQRELLHGWESSPPASNQESLEWDFNRRELTLQSRLFQYTSSGNPRRLSLEQRRGAARDRYGNWYWIGENEREILVNSVGNGQTSHFWASGDGESCAAPVEPGSFQPRSPAPTPRPVQMRGLTVTTMHYLVVGVLASPQGLESPPQADVEPPGLLIFDLHAGGPPERLNWPSQVPFVPFDMAPRPDGGVWILDRLNRRYWALDRHFQVIGTDQVEEELRPERLDDFQPLGGEPTRHASVRFPTGLSLEAASPVSYFDPVAIEALPDGTVLLLEGTPPGAFTRVHRYYYSRELGQPYSTESMKEKLEEDRQAAFSLEGYDFAFVPEHLDDSGDRVPPRLYLVPPEGLQVFAFEPVFGSQPVAPELPEIRQLDFKPLTSFLPLRQFGGKALAGTPDGAYYDFGLQWLPLVEQPRPRFVSEALLYTPLETGRVMDGREPDCLWHSLLLEAAIPHEARVQVWSRAANELQELAVAPWQAEPTLYLRDDGSEQPFTGLQPTDCAGTWQLIFQEQRGRYLQLRLLISGNGRVSPRLRAMRVYYPRFSYLTHYLPEIYSENEPSASFLDRFLANLEGFYTALEDRIAAVQVLFSPDSAPSEALEWLAGWFGIALDPAWDEWRRRLFIRHAMDFFQYRGTLKGLQMALQLTLDDCPTDDIFSLAPPAPGRESPIRIVESFRLRPRVFRPAPTPCEHRQEENWYWNPGMGGEALHQLYRKYLDPDLTPDSAGVRYPVREPQNSVLAGYWQQFSGKVLGFVPGATIQDLPRWQAFLQRRYSSLDQLNSAYGLNQAGSYSSFAVINLPATLPQDGPALLDWFLFEGIVLPMRDKAHRFKVVLPVPQNATANASLYQSRMALAERIIKLEKPVHTTFEVSFYWSAFRVGEARLGSDTLLGLGSRAPDLLPPAVLGQAYLSQSYLAPTYPQNIAERYILGRDRLNS